MKVACLMMQRNESLLIEPWVAYHGSIFGVENLYILDNGSDEVGTLKSLDRASRLGVNVDYQYSAATDFESKGEIMISLIRKLEVSDDYDFFIPLDCDEFVCALGKRSVPAFDELAIYCELKDYLKSDKSLTIPGCFYNVYGRDDYYYYLDTKKTFFARDAAGYLDIGFHEGRSRLSDESDITGISLIHLHNKPFELIRAHAIQKLKNRVPDFNEATLREYTDLGAHLVRYFFMTEVQYLDSFPKDIAQHIPEFRRALVMTGAHYPY